jgi:squalene-associated FAD-dependent desaturase
MASSERTAVSERGAVHVVGGGLAGLAAAVRLTDAGRRVVVHEATGQAGGRCRSYHDQSTGMLIDNGTHLVLSGNRSLLAYARAIDSDGELVGPAEAEFFFFDRATGRRWVLKFSEGRFPWWVFDKDRRVPRTEVVNYLPLAKLAWGTADKPIGDVMNCKGPLYESMLAPFLLAALNIDPRQGSSKLARAVIRETLASGGQACRPLLARNGIGNAFVEPALRHLAGRGVRVCLNDELRSIGFVEGWAKQLVFSNGPVDLSDGGRVILAVPAYAAASLLPGLITPTEFRGIVNAHFRIDPPAYLPPMLGIVNGLCEWVFAHQGRISVTISDAGHLFELPRAELAARIWREVADIAGFDAELPPWQLVRERRATFAAAPEQNARRPDAQTVWSNLFLAGDWTATGLPATLEGAVRSGNRAADLATATLRAVA